MSSRPDAHIGTPPRRRGGRVDDGPAVDLRRNTPASAGRTTTPPPAPTRKPEHSRVGGEDENRVRRFGAISGTPPRRRGGHQRGGRGPASDRNTPASAGRTTPHRSGARRGAEHPRVGGEDGAVAVTCCLIVGTPPRRRGGHFSSWTNRRRCTRSHEQDYNRHGYRPLDHREPHERLTRRLIGRAQARPLDHSWKGSTLACSRCLTSRRRSNSSTQARLAAAFRWARSGRPTRGLFAFVSFGPL